MRDIAGVCAHFARVEFMYYCRHYEVYLQTLSVF